MGRTVQRSSRGPKKEPAASPCPLLPALAPTRPGLRGPRQPQTHSPTSAVHVHGGLWGAWASSLAAGPGCG